MRSILAVVLAVLVLVFCGQAVSGQKSGSQSKSVPSATTSTTISSSATSASAIAICGIKPPPPVGFWPDDAVCLCDGKKCKWVWMKR